MVSADDTAAAVIGLVAQQFAGNDYSTLTTLTECSFAFREAVLPALYSHLEPQHLAHPRLLYTLELQLRCGNYVKSVHWELIRSSKGPKISRTLSRLYSSYPKYEPVHQRYISRQKARSAMLLNLAVLSQFSKLRCLTITLREQYESPPFPFNAAALDEDAEVDNAMDEDMVALTTEEMEATANEEMRQAVDHRQTHLILPSATDWQEMPFLATVQTLRFHDPGSQHKFRVHYEGLTGLPDLLPSLCSVDLLGPSIFSLGIGPQPAFMSKISHFSHTGADDISETLWALAPQLLSLRLQLARDGSNESIKIADFLANQKKALPVCPRLESLTLANVVMDKESTNSWITVLDCLPACRSITIHRLMQYIYPEKGKSAPVRLPYLDSFAAGLSAASNFALGTNLSLDISCDRFPSYISDKVSFASILALCRDPRWQELNMQWDLGENEEMLATLQLDEDDQCMLSDAEQLKNIRSALIRECTALSQFRGKSLRVKAGFEHFSNDGVDVESVKVLTVEVDRDGTMACRM